MFWTNTGLYKHSVLCHNISISVAGWMVTQMGVPVLYPLREQTPYIPVWCQERETIRTQHLQRECRGAQDEAETGRGERSSYLLKYTESFYSDSFQLLDTVHHLV